MLTDDWLRPPLPFEEPPADAVTIWDKQRYVKVRGRGPIHIANWRMENWLATLSVEQRLTIARAVYNPDGTLPRWLVNMRLEEDMTGKYGRPLTPTQIIMANSHNHPDVGLPDFNDRTPPTEST